MDTTLLTMRLAGRRALTLLTLVVGLVAVALVPPRPVSSTATMTATGTTSFSVAPGRSVATGGLRVGGATSAWATLTVTGPGSVTLPCAAACPGVTLVTGDGTADTLLRLHGSTTDVNAALSTLTATASGPGTVTITLAVDDGALAFLPDNGHFYEWRAGPVDWLTARAAALASSHAGLTGYLVSITSDAESTLAHGLMTTTLAHIGVSDIVNEGYWYLVDGPEAGTGTGGYNHWLPGEPSGDGDGAVLWVDLTGATGPIDGWNDLSETSACCGYIIEYGGIGTYAPPTATITLTAATPVTTTTSTTTTSTTTTSTTSTSTTSVSTSTTTSTGGVTTTSAAPASTSTPPETATTDTTPGSTPGTVGPGTPGGDSDSSGGSGGSGDGPPSGDWTADIRLDARIGDPVEGIDVLLEGADLRPDTPIEAGVHSEYTILTVAPTDSEGHFRATAALPALEPGEHTIELRYEGSDLVLDSARFTVDRAGRLTSADERLGVEDPAPYDPADDVDLLLGLGVAALTILGATQTGTAGGRGAGSGSASDAESGAGSETGAGADRADESGTVSEVDATVQRVDLTGTGRGDRARTFRSPGTVRVDAGITAAAQWLGPRVPLLARGLADGSALRAMFGSLALGIPALALAFGVMAGRSTDLAGITPAVGLMAAVVVLSALDGVAGISAATGFAVTTVASGHLDGLDAALSLGGMAVLMMSTPFVAAAARPLRRAPELTWQHRWDRVADVVIGALLAGWAIQSMAAALPGLSGRSVSLADGADQLALVAMVAVVVRIGVEVVAAHHYPARLEAIHLDQVPDPSSRRKLVTIATRTALFCLASQRFIGTNWWLVGGTAIYAAPQLAGLASARFPASASLDRWLPRGILKLAIMMLVGTAWGAVVARLAEGGDALRLGFVTLPLPGLAVSTVALFAKKGQRPALRWSHRVGGLLVVIWCTLVATGHVM